MRHTDLKVYVRTDKNGTQIYEDWRCPHCGGAGGADAWTYTGYTCWECGGSGKRSKPKLVKVYTPEYEEKLRAQREKAHQKKLAQLRAKAQELNAEFFKKNGFDDLGRMYVVLGNTYDIKDELKAMGCKFNPAIGWHSDRELNPDEYQTIMLTADQLYDADEAGVFNSRWWKYEEARELIKKANESLTSSSSSSSYVGEVGEKIEITAKVTGFHSYKTHFNGHTIHNSINTFTDEAGNVYIWKTTAYFDAFVGDKVKITATIKGHSEYKGIKQTELQRAKITKEEN